jgi:hypothetical protein
MLKAVMGVVGIGILLLSGTPSAHGQKATEIFIPIGQSPGLSNKISIIGTIEAVDARAQTIVVAGPSGSWSATITDRTKIWLDKSKLRLSNQEGTLTDLRKGLLAEVKYEEAGVRKGPADWIKVQITESGGNPGEGRQ